MAIHFTSTKSLNTISRNITHETINLDISRKTFVIFMNINWTMQFLLQCICCPNVIKMSMSQQDAIYNLIFFNH